jgi:hypothetical protein
MTTLGTTPSRTRTFAAPHPASVVSLPSVFAHLPRPATMAHHAVGWRQRALLGAAIAAPVATSLAFGRGNARRGWLAGGLAALAIGALRGQMARWFTPEPAYQSDGMLGALELRRYTGYIEATTEIDAAAIDLALDHGYGRLASYVCGANRNAEIVERAAPVLTAMRDGRYTVSFVMPPGRTLYSLPRPRHPGVELREVAARNVAVLRFRGRFTRDNIAAHERKLLEQVLALGLSARGSVMFAAFDWPLTLPVLRRNELWLEVTS